MYQPFCSLKECRNLQKSDDIYKFCPYCGKAYSEDEIKRVRAASACSNIELLYIMLVVGVMMILSMGIFSAIHSAIVGLMVSVMIVVTAFVAMHYIRKYWIYPRFPELFNKK